MKKFALTAATFTGQITYIFNEQGFLISYHNEADLTEVQMKWILKRIPLTIDELESQILSTKAFKAIEIPFSITFEMMWDRYDDKSRSSRKKSLIKWNNLNEANQVKAYNFHGKYNRNRGSAEKKYLETYLHAELWNN